MADRRAVVIGGSLAGFSAARVLAWFFDRVTVIDRDAYPARVAHRPGVPQARHVHALLARGRQELERLFPGFERTMLERGALEVDFGWDVAALRPLGWAPRERSGVRSLFSTRVLLDAVVREQMRLAPNVEVLEHAAVVGLLAARTHRPEVAGVRVAGAEGGPIADIAADLVVDASGRASKAPGWLRAIGLEPPRETVVDALAGYSTRWFMAPEPARMPADWWWKAVWIDPAPPRHQMAGVLFPVEDGRWMVTVAGVGGHYPPSDEAGFTAALDRLRSPLLAQAVRLAEPISPVYGNRAMANRFRHYERWARYPPGFVALGDAVCAFNPVYGQGMTTAAVSAGILEDCLDRVGPTAPDLPRRFFRAQARFLQQPWAMATGADLRIPETRGERPLMARLVGPYMEALFASACDDAHVCRRLVEVINMVRPLSAFFAPPMLARVARHAVSRWTAGGFPGGPVPTLPPVPGATLQAS